MLRRLVETNMDETLGYGADPYCQSATERIREACGCHGARVYFLTGGTQVNATVMYAVLRHCQGVISPVTGHINHHESGAVEATGHKVIALPGHDGGKLNAKEVRDYLKAYRADENYAHIVEPGMVYIRLAYALASDNTDITLKDIASLCDIFYIGGTKCGALFGEALVIPDPGLTGELFSIIKQRGAMLAKGRLLGLQFDTLFTDGLACRWTQSQRLQLSYSTADQPALRHHGQCRDRAAAQGSLLLSVGARGRRPQRDTACHRLGHSKGRHRGSARSALISGRRPSRPGPAQDDGQRNGSAAQPLQ